MIRMVRVVGIVVLTTLVIAPAAAAAPDPLTHRSAATAAGDRLLDVQFESGAMPWVVGDPGEFQNVQGITAQGLLAAYKVSLDQRYLNGGAGGGAEGVRDWLADYMAANPGSSMSSGSTFFLAEYAVLTLQLDDLALARRAFDRAVAAAATPTPAGLVEHIVQARKNQGHTNLGIWDAALFIRAAQDAGLADAADEMAAALLAQDIVDPFDSGANWYEIGLTGLLFGLAEADVLGHADTLNEAKEALLATRCDDGSFPVTWQGSVFCGDTQTTAYAAIGLSAVGDIMAATDACGHLASTQDPSGGWDLGGFEIAEVDAEGAMALAGCALLVPKGLVDYTDQVRGLF